ncbi:glycine-rich domain-containing protein [Massilia sp. PWRC2]|uniref:glycine-rich domain-containing protein n=1 Tax=Massilia sp. PWRC2 TaxID=2804626 RepID=UPI003CE78DB7
MDSTTAMRTCAELDLTPIKLKLMHRESGEGWTLEHADAVEVEYRRFLCLLQMYPHEDFAPLLDVDIFWHYHILDTRKYAADCQQVFGRFIHHHPYVGLGADDGADHQAFGTCMHALYQATFGEPCLVGASTDDALKQVQPTAYCSAPGQQQQTAYCSVTGKQQTAYCSKLGKRQTAYCSKLDQQQTAYCSVTGKQHTAYCSAMVQSKQIAYCSVVGQSPMTAYCSATGHALQTAYCSAPAATRPQQTAWQSHSPDFRQSAWLSAANQVTLLAA